MNKILALAAIGLLGAGQAVRAADIIGTVTFKGTPPAEVVNDKILDDATCGSLYAGKAPTTHHYVVGSHGEFGNVVVSLNLTGKSTGASVPPAVLDQKDCLYSPSIMVIQTGQKLIVRNSDPTIHNVHLNPADPDNEKANDAQINIVQMSGGADLNYTFPKPEKFLKFQCDVHQWMFAWVTIEDSPYYCLTGTDGKFVIKNVPPGKYTIEAAHRKAGAQTQDIVVADKDVTVNFTYEPKP